MSETIQIAVDGPAVSGKSSAARRLAFRLGFLYLDSGAVYRAVTLEKMRGLDLSEDGLNVRLDGLGIELLQIPGGEGCLVMCRGRDVSGEIRSQEVSVNTSPVAANPVVREWITSMLRKAAKSQDVVMDGRDIGSVVFPSARFKFYVTAAPEVRARRRIADLAKSGVSASFDEILEAIRRRDAADLGRAAGPLVQTPDAVLIDNSALSLEDTVEAMHSRIRKALQKKKT